MKKLIILLITIIIVGLLTGCCNDTNYDEIKFNWKRCGTISKPDGDMSVYYDVDTKVMYASGVYISSVLLNPDGTPMLYEGGDK